MSNILPNGQCERGRSFDLIITRLFFERLISDFVHLVQQVSVVNNNFSNSSKTYSHRNVPFYSDFVSLLYSALDLRMNFHRFDNLSVDGLA